MRTLNLLLLLISFLCIGCYSQSSYNNNGNSNDDDDCICNSYSGDAENFDIDGECKYCQTCSNNACKCPSKSECETMGVIIGIVFAVIFVLCYIGCGIFFFQSRKRKKRRMIYTEPATYVSNTVITTLHQPQYPMGLPQQPVVMQQPQVIYVQQPIQSIQQQQIYTEEQQPMKAMQIEAPPSYDNVAVGNDGDQVTNY
eukprot:43739_1